MKVAMKVNPADTQRFVVISDVIPHSQCKFTSVRRNAVLMSE